MLSIFLHSIAPYRIISSFFRHSNPNKRLQTPDFFSLCNVRVRALIVLSDTLRTLCASGFPACLLTAPLQTAVWSSLSFSSPRVSVRDGIFLSSLALLGTAQRISLRGWYISVGDEWKLVEFAVVAQRLNWRVEWEVKYRLRGSCFLLEFEWCGRVSDGITSLQKARFASFHIRIFSIWYLV